MDFRHESEPASLREESDPRFRAVYEKAAETVKGPSHDRYHIDMVLTRAGQLADWCEKNQTGVDRGTLYPACCLHDLGRDNPNLHGRESIEASISRARLILLDSGYNEKETEATCQIISEHDQPELSPSNLEALILKEADFLAGFGAWGIFRAIAWGIESGRSTKEIIVTLSEKMPGRIKSLQLPPSKNIAWREWPVVALFLAQLEHQLSWQEQETYPGKYIIFEGISGSGKDTQAERLREYLIEKGLSAAVLNEPSKTGIALRRAAKEMAARVGEGLGSVEQALLFTMDRIGVTGEVKGRLRKGETVIGIRSFLSTMVYQGQTPLGMAEILFLNRFVPRPDLLILLDLPPETALARIRQRSQTTGIPVGDFEELTKLETARRGFQEALRFLPIPTRIIPADGFPEEVFKLIKQAVDQSL